jgi:hypothetical protein
MTAGRATITSTAADLVGCAAELLHLVCGKVTNSLALQWVAKEDSTGDLRRLDPVAKGVVDDHSALTVTRDDDLGAGALGERSLDELSHDLAAISTQVGVALRIKSACPELR